MLKDTTQAFKTEARGGILGSEQGTTTLNKCYYLITEGVTQAIKGTEDDTTVVTPCTSKNEITAEQLNANINLIEHEDEWKEWKQGKEYPILELDKKEN